MHVRNAKIVLKHKLTTTNQTYQRTLIEIHAEMPDLRCIPTSFALFCVPC